MVVDSSECSELASVFTRIEYTGGGSCVTWVSRFVDDDDDVLVSNTGDLAMACGEDSDWFPRWVT